MEPSDRSAPARSSDRAPGAFRRARLAYERAHVLAGFRGVVASAALAALAVGLHATTSTTWLVAGTLAISLAVHGWRGGAWRRGTSAGVLAGLPPLIAPSVVFVLSHSGHCPSCQHPAALPCMITCFATSSLVGTLVGTRAASDRSPRRFATAAITSAALTGLLGCGTIGLSGALGIVVGLVAGGVTGWVVAARSAHA